MCITFEDGIMASNSYLNQCWFVITAVQFPYASFAKRCFKITHLKVYLNVTWINLLFFIPRVKGVLWWSVISDHQSIFKFPLAHTYVFSCRALNINIITLHWCKLSHVVSNHWLLTVFFISLLGLISKIISKVNIRGPLWGKSTSTVIRK